MPHNMDNERKQHITLTLADVDPIPLIIPAGQEAHYREVERMVNTLWQKWSVRLADTVTPHELLVRVAFQFAKKYLEVFQDNQRVYNYLTEFEKQIDQLVIQK